MTYEWLITASEEIQMFWHKPFSAAAALFYVNRYMGLVVPWCNVVLLTISSSDAEVRLACSLLSENVR